MQHLLHNSRKTKGNTKEKGHHADKVNNPTDAAETSEIPLKVKKSRRPRNNAPGPGQTKTMDTLVHTAKKHGHGPRVGTTLRITKHTRGRIPIHQKGNNVERRKNALSPDQAV